MVARGINHLIRGLGLSISHPDLPLRRVRGLEVKIIITSGQWYINHSYIHNGVFMKTLKESIWRASRLAHRSVPGPQPPSLDDFCHPGCDTAPWTEPRRRQGSRLWPQASPGLTEGWVCPTEPALSSWALVASAQKWGRENHTRLRGHCDH